MTIDSAVRSPLPLTPLLLDLPAVPESAVQARHAVVGYGGKVLPDTFGLAIAVSEAVTNVVLHAYRDGTPGRVRIRAAVAGEVLTVSVQDDGVGMVPRPDTPGLGLGLPLIAQVADGFDVESAAPGGTRLVIRFALSATD